MYAHTDIRAYTLPRPRPINKPAQYTFVLRELQQRKCERKPFHRVRSVACSHLLGSPTTVSFLPPPRPYSQLERDAVRCLLATALRKTEFYCLRLSRLPRHAPGNLRRAQGRRMMYSAARICESNESPSGSMRGRRQPGGAANSRRHRRPHSGGRRECRPPFAARAPVGGVTPASLHSRRRPRRGYVRVKVSAGIIAFAAEAPLVSGGAFETARFAAHTRRH